MHLSILFYFLVRRCPPRGGSRRKIRQCTDVSPPHQCYLSKTTMATSAASLRQAWVSLGTSASKSLQQGFAHLEGPDGRTNVIAQASGQQVCILDGSYRLQTTLSFASSVPSSDSPSSHRKWYLHCLALGELAGERILAAASFDRVSIWTSSYSGDWRLHSSFDAGDVVTCLSLAGGQ